jgi:hypothetical protein
MCSCRIKGVEKATAPMASDSTDKEPYSRCHHGPYQAHQPGPGCIPFQSLLLEEPDRQRHNSHCPSWSMEQTPLRDAQWALGGRCRVTDEHTSGTLPPPNLPSSRNHHPFPITTGLPPLSSCLRLRAPPQLQGCKAHMISC